MCVLCRKNNPIRKKNKSSAHSPRFMGKSMSPANLVNLHRTEKEHFVFIDEVTLKWLVPASRVPEKFQPGNFVPFTDWMLCGWRFFCVVNRSNRRWLCRQSFVAQCENKNHYKLLLRRYLVAASGSEACLEVIFERKCHSLMLREMYLRVLLPICVKPRLRGVLGSIRIFAGWSLLAYSYRMWD